MRPVLHGSALVGAAGVAWRQVRRRRSQAVQNWHRSTTPGRRAGPLHVRAAGSGTDTVVLLHGLVATGDIFGRPFDELASGANLVVPDLLGFGRSLDEHRERFSPDDHLDALEAALSDLGLADQELRIGAHSMGSALAMRWIERGTARIASVSCFGPPVYRTSDGIDSTIAASGLMARAFVADTEWARAACHLNCSHRQLAGIVAALASPQLPTAIARSASLHTWPAYRDAMDQLIGDTDWGNALDQAARQRIPVAFVWGADDRIGDPDYASTLLGATTDIVPNAGHHLPMTHPTLCVGYLESGEDSRAGLEGPVPGQGKTG